MIATEAKNHVIDALEQKHFFKLVCGASLTDTEMIENLCFIFTLAGAHVIDLAPQADVILAARRGIKKALVTRHSSLATPLLMASIQIDKDPHFRKVEVDYNLCDLCGACVSVCPTGAFSVKDGDREFIYLTERCFGCSICSGYCHVSALKTIDTKPSPKETLKEMLSLGVQAIEFHFGKSYIKLAEIWDDIKDLVKDLELVSFSIGSELLDEEEIKKTAKLCCRLGNKGIILQCDGTPMSGGLKNGHNKDKSCLQVAKIIQEEKLPVYLQISGGTTEKSYSKAYNAGININGVAIGSHARKLLMPYLNNSDDKETLHNAVNIARSLVNSVGADLVPAHL